MEGNADFLERLEAKERTELLKLIDLKVENELLNKYLKDNPLPFCLKVAENMPFEVNFSATMITIRIVEMIKKGELVLK